jgi:S-adenosylmethionine hydrolase
MNIISLTTDFGLDDNFVGVMNRTILKPVSATFHGQDIFAPVAAFTAQEEKIEKFGNIIPWPGYLCASSSVYRTGRKN